MWRRSIFSTGREDSQFTKIMSPNSNAGPVTERQRYIILDALRGFALLGIAIANFPEFSLWTFLSEEATAAMPTAQVD